MDFISPKYLMKIVREVNDVIWAEYKTYREVRNYINKWYQSDNYWENFSIVTKDNEEIDLLATLHNIDGNTMLQIAVDIGVDTPDFIPSIATFRNEIKADYKTTNATFDKAFKQIETHPDIAIGLANSALESIIKEIIKDERINIQQREEKTLYDLTCSLLKEFQLFPNGNMPQEIKTIGSSLIAINQSIEKLRSTKTVFHGKTNSDYFIEEPLYAYFVINAVTTVGLFLKSFYDKKFIKLYPTQNDNSDDLPF